MDKISEQSESAQSFAYEKRGNSAVIWRCFSRDSIASIPEQIDGLAVTALAPYAFSAHMDKVSFCREIENGKIYISDSWLLDEIKSANGASDSDTIAGSRDAADRKRDGAELLTIHLLQQLPELMGEHLEEIVLPASLERAGRYCFYNCSRLKKIDFANRLADWGSGTFTGCHRIREVEVQMLDERPSGLKDLLDEVLEEVQITVKETEESPVRLMIPEFYEEGIENYEARIIDTKIHGAGMRYRNCFRDRKIDYYQYDRMFSYAVAQEADEFTVRMVLCRLRFPKELGSDARNRYERYLTEHPEEFAVYLCKAEDMEGTRLILNILDEKKTCVRENMEVSFNPADQALDRFLDAFIERAGRANYAEGLSFAMDFRHGSDSAEDSPGKNREKRKRRRMEL